MRSISNSPSLHLATVEADRIVPRFDSKQDVERKSTTSPEISEYKHEAKALVISCSNLLPQALIGWTFPNLCCIAHIVQSSTRLQLIQIVRPANHHYERQSSQTGCQTQSIHSADRFSKGFLLWGRPASTTRTRAHRWIAGIFAVDRRARRRYASSGQEVVASQTLYNTIHHYCSFGYHRVEFGLRWYILGSKGMIWSKSAFYLRQLIWG